MRVSDAPYDLVVLVACADLEQFLGTLIERGEKMGCLAPIRFRVVRDPMRDQICNAPERLLSPFLKAPNCRFLVAWDHQGSGSEREAARDVEADVVNRLTRAGLDPSSVAALAVVPELETALQPVWPRVQQILSQVRKRKDPPDEASLLKQLAKNGYAHESVSQAMAAHPKEVLEALVACLALRWSPALFQTLGNELSIPVLKRGPFSARLAQTLEGWFPRNGST